ncbi:MAG: NAD(+)/NADH kinase [Desulfitobacteriaceae bacterium]|nr:NAD(+)/NADH kinase [Desulfitobacteriaceae bacterium]MDD4752260.1 NAD(+)/NADH kinase [Desulfitobacteriaceae bacterium]
MDAVCLVTNMKKENALVVAEQLESWFLEHGIKVVRCAQGGKFNKEGFLSSQDGNILETVDMILVLGGDGTLLNTARAAAPYRIPLLGINMGHLGFLTEVELNDMFSSLEKLAAGEYRMEERMMLKCTLVRAGSSIGEFLALNDVVLTKGAFSRMIIFDIFVDQQFVDTYPADGLIISSPTGSTAYSLSAGGPIVSPDMELMLITPICPHTLHSRPIVICPNKEVRVVLKSDLAEVMLTIDGQYGYRLQRGDEILVQESHWKTRLIRLKNKSFYDILREKLRESGGKNLL